MLGVCRHLNHRYFQIVFDNYDKYPYGRDVMIDCAHLELVLRSLETGGGPPDRKIQAGRTVASPIQILLSVICRGHPSLPLPRTGGI